MCGQRGKTNKNMSMIFWKNTNAAFMPSILIMIGSYWGAVWHSGFKNVPTWSAVWKVKKPSFVCFLKESIVGVILVRLARASLELFYSGGVRVSIRRQRPFIFFLKSFAKRLTPLKICAAKSDKKQNKTNKNNNNNNKKKTQKGGFNKRTK